MKKAIIISLFILLIAVSAFAQTNDKLNCPVFGVTPPDAAVNPEELMKFSTSLDEKIIKDFNLKLIWRVDKGTIVKGQGTKELLVSTIGLASTTIYATLEVLGLPEKCVNKYSDAGIVYIERYDSDFDEFENIPNDDVRARIDNLFIQIQNNPNSTAYIVSYGSRKDVRKRENLIRNHVKFRGFDIKRIVFQHKGEEPQIRTRFLVLPKGADTSIID